MKTKYIKIELSVRKPNEGWVLTPSGGWLFINGKFKCPHSGEIQNENDIKFWLEEINDNTYLLISEMKETITDLNILKYQILDANKTNPRFDGMFELIEKWIERKKILIQ